MKKLDIKWGCMICFFCGVLGNTFFNSAVDAITNHGWKNYLIGFIFLVVCLIFVGLNVYVLTFLDKSYISWGVLHEQKLKQYAGKKFNERLRKYDSD